LIVERPFENGIENRVLLKVKDPCPVRLGEEIEDAQGGKKKPLLGRDGCNEK
jgi:hypothetical protein